VGFRSTAAVQGYFYDPVTHCKLPDCEESRCSTRKYPITPTGSGGLFWNRSKRLGFLLPVKQVIQTLGLLFLILDLLAIRLPGTLLAFIMLPEVCFLHVPFVPTPEGQYLVKDVVILFAAIAIGGSVREENTSHQYH